MVWKAFVFAAVILVIGCSRSPESEANVSAETAAPAEAAPRAPDPRRARLASLPAPYNGADLDNGARRFRRCSNCHMIAAEGRALVGPNLYGLFERRVGEGEAFAYSDALLEADFLWTPARLDEWLAEPRAFLPGNRMAFAGLDDPDDRRDVIAHVLVESGFRPAAASAPAPGEPTPADGDAAWRTIAPDAASASDGPGD